MSTASFPHLHPLLAGTAVMAATLDDMAGCDPDWLPPNAKGTLLSDLARLAERLAAMKLRVLAGADDVATATGARSAAAWLAAETLVKPGRLVHEQALGEALTLRYPDTWAGLAAGDYTLGHAQAVTDSLDALHTRVDQATRTKAEQLLIGHCHTYTPPEIRRLGRHILHAIDPELADEEDRKALEAEEANAHDRARLALHPLGDGRTRITGEIPDPIAGILNAALDALLSPRRHGQDAAVGEGSEEPGTGPVIPLTDPATGLKVPTPVRRGQAFCALIEHLPVDGFPTTGGSPITITVTLDWNQLRRDFTTTAEGPGTRSENRTGTAGAGRGTASTSTGVDVTPGQARRWACSHGILPVVLGGDSVPLDLGRTRRLFSHHQIKAHQIRHRECQAEGCQIPAAWCEAHHKTPWSAGGPTDLDQLALLCSHHHHRIHDHRYRHTWTPTDSVTFNLRT